MAGDGPLVSGGGTLPRRRCWHVRASEDGLAQMKAVAVMTAASVSAYIVASMLVDGRVQRELLWGMAGPLLAVSGSWLAIERAYRRDPGAVTRLMIAGFGFKIVFFGTYVVVMLRGLALSPVPFVVSFVS